MNKAGVDEMRVNVKEISAIKINITLLWISRKCSRRVRHFTREAPRYKMQTH